MQSQEKWLDSILPRHERLTKVASYILENLLAENRIEYLTITGRTKNKSSALEKLIRKGYKDPSMQLTDLSGIRVVVYLETDLKSVCGIIEQAFEVDENNSSSKELTMGIDKIGYRSYHYVCKLGKNRENASEYKNLSQLNFEIQVRTVLQHAWAQLSHDRNYKFNGNLPRELERDFYLYAGLLEIVDKGFDAITAKIDLYKETLREKTAGGDYDIDVTSLSLNEFVNQWAEKNNFYLKEHQNQDRISDLVEELKQFGIKKIYELNDIIDPIYAKTAKQAKYYTNIFGLIRDWMLIKDWRRFIRDVKFEWIFDTDEQTILGQIIPRDSFDEMIVCFEGHNFSLYPDHDMQ